MIKTDIFLYQALVIAHGLEFWVKHKMQVNRAYKPSDLMRMAVKITGNKYKARDYTKAAQDLKDLVEASYANRS